MLLKAALASGHVFAWRFVMEMYCCELTAQESPQLIACLGMDLERTGGRLCSKLQNLQTILQNSSCDVHVGAAETTCVVVRSDDEDDASLMNLEKGASCSLRGMHSCTTFPYSSI